jgi:hypothetical protein
MAEDAAALYSDLQALKGKGAAAPPKGGENTGEALWQDLQSMKRPPSAEGEPAEAKANPGESLWEGLKKFAAKPAGEMFEDLGRGAKEIPGRVAEIGGNLAKGLMPTEAGARAGGEAVRQLGDVGAFAAGGLTNPLQPAMGRPAPRPQIAPPQAMAPPNGPAVPPQGIRPPMPGAVPSAPSVAGRPEIVPNPGGGFDVHTNSPAGVLYAGTSGEAQRLAQRHGLLGGVPANTNTPGAAPAKPASPLVPAGAEMGEPSKFASAIFGNDPAPIDRALTRQYRRVMKPGGDPAGMAHQDRQITTAVDSIIDASKNENLRLMDANDRELPAGRMPSTLGEFVQGIDELKTQVFKEYDGMARTQGGQGIQVPLQPALAKLQEIASENPELADHAAAQARKWAEAGQYSPLQMQNAIRSLYKSTKGINESVGMNEVKAQVLPTLTKTLNDAMAAALQGPQYQGLRNRYGSLTSIEDDVSNAFRKDLAKRPGGLGDKLADTSALIAALHGVFSHDVRTMGVAAGVEAMKYLRRYLAEPNRAVASMFRRRAAEISPPMTDQMGAARAAGPLSLGVEGDERRRRDLSLYPHVSVSGP